MSKRYKNTTSDYLDSSIIAYNRENLTDILNAKAKMLKIGLSANQSISANTTTKIMFDTAYKDNFGSDYERYFRVVDGNIEIMHESIHCVVVVVSIQFNAVEKGYLYINKQNEGRYATIYNYGGGVTATAIIPVSKGDKINAEVWYPSDGTILDWSDATFMEIVAI